MSEVAIAIPCLNEARNLESLLPQIQKVIAHFKIPAQVVVVDGGSVDDTVQVAERFGATVLHQRGVGYGAAIGSALKDIECEYVITMDGDCSHPPVMLHYLYRERHAAEIVIASRYVPQGYADMPRWRRVLSGLLNKSFGVMLGLPVLDLSSGYRLYRRDAVQKLDLQMQTFAVLQEALIKSYCEGYAIKEIPMHFSPGVHGRNHAKLVRLGRDYLRTFRAMWRLRNSVDSCDYDTRAFYSKIPLQRYWQRRRYAIITRYIDGALRVLDAGCGSTQIMNGAPQVVGLDPQMRKLRFMRSSGRRLVNGSTFGLPFATGAFDVVISSQVIEHLPEDDTIFSELVRCLAPGGLLILGTVDYGGWQWPLIEWAYDLAKPTGYVREHITHYTRRSLFDRLTKMGLTVEDHQYILGGEIIIAARKPGPRAS